MIAVFRGLVVAMLFTTAGTCGAAAAPVQIRFDTSQTPDAAAYTRAITGLIQEWYPKINAILFGADSPLRFTEIQVVFEPRIQWGSGSKLTEVPAYANGNAIHVNFGYLTRMPDDYKAMLIHELAHVNQQYGKVPSDAGWLVEGIADYIRHKYFEKDIEPKLRLDKEGYLKGYSREAPFFFSLEQSKARLDDRGYRLSYTVASVFLFWLEERKDRAIIPVLNLALSKHQYSEKLFRQQCGAPLDALWREFLQQSQPGNPQPAAALPK
jgi:hypothetical protein